MVTATELAAIVRSITRKNPGELTDDEFFQALRDYAVLEKRRYIDLQRTITNSLVEFWNQINKR